MFIEKVQCYLWSEISPTLRPQLPGVNIFPNDGTFVETKTLILV